MKPQRRNQRRSSPVGPSGGRELSHVDASGRARMVDVGGKAPTARRAVAEGRVRISPLLADRIRADDLAKGNLLEVARLAGIAAAKRTDELIPLCHSLPLEHVAVEAWLAAAPPHVRLRAEVATFARTGVEMEALTAVAVAALTVIDMGKAVDPAMVVEEIRLIEKTGGTSGDFAAALTGDNLSPALSTEDPPPAFSADRPPPPFSADSPPPPFSREPKLAGGERRRARRFTVAILTVSDRCSTGLAVDTSGPALAKLVRDRLAGQVIAADCVPDEADQIAGRLRQWALSEPKGPRPDLILTTGGTGLSPRDVTPEATAGALERRHPGLLELARMRCYPRTPRAFLSRGEAGTIGRSLVINLPGSPAGATEFLEALLDVLPHAIETLRGHGEDHGKGGAANKP